MPVKMIALRTSSSNDDSKEYQAGQSFSVSNEREAARLERMRKAKRDIQKAEQRAPQPARGTLRTKVMTPEPAPTPVVAVEPTTETAVQQASPETPTIEPAGNRYRRNDMRAED